MVFVLGWARATTASTGLPRRMASLTRSSKSVLSPDLLIIEIHEFNDLCVNLYVRKRGVCFFDAAADMDVKSHALGTRQNLKYILVGFGTSFCTPR